MKVIEQTTKDYYLKFTFAVGPGVLDVWTHFASPKTGRLYWANRYTTSQPNFVWSKHTLQLITNHEMKKVRRYYQGA